MESTGLRTTVVDVATMSLYNAFRYSYSDLTGSSLLIDIGARTTNLLFIEPAKIFSRSAPIGGSSITLRNPAPKSNAARRSDDDRINHRVKPGGDGPSGHGDWRSG